MKYFIRFLLFIILAVLVLPAIGKCQVKPSDFPEETNPTTTNFEVYSQKGGINKRASLASLKKYFVPIVFGSIAYVPTPSGNASNRGEFVRDPNGDSWYIDATGTATVLGKSYTAGTGISVTGSVIANTGDLSATNEIQRLDTFAVVSGVLRASLLNDGVPFSSVNLPVADGSETKVTSGTATNVTGLGTTASPYIVNNTGDTNPGDDLTTSSSAAGDVTGLFSNLQIAANAVGTAEIADNAVSANKIANAQVTFAKMQNISTGTLIGRSTAGSGSPELITPGSNLSLSGGVLNTNFTPLTGPGVAGRIPYFSSATLFVTNSGFYRISDGGTNNYSYVINEASHGLRIGRSGPVKNAFNEMLTVKASYDGASNFITPVVIDGVTPSAGTYKGNLGIQLVCYGDGTNQAGSGLISLARYGNTQSDYALTFGLSDQGGNRVPFYMRADGQTVYNGNTPTANTAHTFYGRSSLSTTNALSVKNGGGSLVFTIQDDSKVYFNNQTGATAQVAQLGTDGELLRTSINVSDVLTTSTAAGGDLNGTLANLQIVAGAVGNAEIANGAVNSAKITDGSVGPLDLNAGTATVGNVLMYNGVGNGFEDKASGGDITGPYNNLQIAANAVSSAEIATDAIGLSELGNGSVDPAALFFSSYSMGSTIWSDGSAWNFGQNIREGYTDNNLGGGSGSYTMTASRIDNIVRGSSWTSLTVNLPASPADGQIAKLIFDVTAAAVTFSGNGKTLVGSLPSSIAVGDNFSFKYYLTTDKWYRINL